MNEILIVAGENSGDQHAAGVVNNFTKFHPKYHFFGAGGDLMKAAGVELHAHVNDLAVMGFSGIPRIIPTLGSLKRKLLRRVREHHVRLAILVDYPGFNLNLARTLKALPNPPKILEYIAPQVWAWRANRIAKIRAYVDHLAVVFPFEVKLFKSANISVTFVGHPLLEEMNLPPITQSDINDNTLLDANILRQDILSSNPMLALLPGSRRTVATRHLPIMIEAAKLVISEFPDIRICIGCAPGLRSHIEKITENKIARIELWEDSRALLSEATAAVVCSGTATLETALIGTPQVIVYKTTGINYLIIKRLIRLPYVGLVNVVAKERMVPELLQSEFNPSALYRAIAPMLRSSNIREYTRLKLLRLRTMLGDPGAARKVADLAFGMITIT